MNGKKVSGNIKTGMAFVENIVTKAKKRKDCVTCKYYETALNETPCNSCDDCYNMYELEID